mmetsp:Transcript_43693/g.81197  ORF Transcript_43693/g.81197 Transcript_43693/m.81197 type:complete len:346 (+) Transcript_43693:91-1128(+)
MARIHGSHLGFILLLWANHVGFAVHFASKSTTTAASDFWTRAPTFPMPTPDPPKHMAATRALPASPKLKKAPALIKPKLGRESEEVPQEPNPPALSRVAQPAMVDNSHNYTVTFAVGNLSDGSSGIFVIRVFPSWAPNSADRFRTLVNEQFFDNSRFFRVIPSFLVQFGIAADPVVTAQWSTKTIKEDLKVNDIQNVRGRLAFASSGPGTRSTQIFINIADNPNLDDQGFPPFAEVVSGMDVIDKLYSGYGEGAPLGPGPKQTRIEFLGNAYLDEFFPGLSYIQKARIETSDRTYQAFPRLSFILLGVLIAVFGSTLALQRTGGLQKHAMKWRWISLFDTVVHET